jgi:3D (Asp-Asp-Asp) domain-containing protein
LEAVRLVLGVTAVLVVALAAPASADESKLGKESLLISAKTRTVGKNKVRAGYPLSEDRGFALRFYWLAMEERHLADPDPEEEEVDVYTQDGFFLGRYGEGFVRALRMEGSGLLADGRVINYDGKCDYGVGTCFETLDHDTHPFGRGAGRRALRPFKSVAVDPRLIPIGEPIYIPEFDGMVMPDGQIHDGCVRADDTGGGIKKRKMDFFVVSYPNFRYLLSELWGVIWITPHIEVPRCEYLRQR